MSRHNEEIRILEKTKLIVRDKLPGFASRYFRDNVSLKAPGSLYGYALDLKSFFEYLETIGYQVKKMTLEDLESITPENIEDYLEYVRNHIKPTTKAGNSTSGLHRKFGAISSFFNYYYRLDLINRNPVHKVSSPKPVKNITEIPSNKTNFEMLDFVVNGELSGHMNSYCKHTKERDLAIIMLIMGAGLKGSEVVNLDINDVDLQNNQIIVNSGKSSRTVFISQTISNAVSQYLNIRLDIIADEDDSEALFLSLQCKRICLRAVQKMVKKYSSAMFDGKHHLTPKALSLSFKNNVFEQTKNTRITSVATGNDQYTTLRRYRGLVDDYELKKGSEFDPKLS